MNIGQNVKVQEFSDSLSMKEGLLSYALKQWRRCRNFLKRKNPKVHGLNLENV